VIDEKNRVIRRDMVELSQHDQSVTVAYYGEELHGGVPLPRFSRMSPLNTVLFYLLYLIFNKMCPILHFSFPLLSVLIIGEQRL